MAEKEEPRAPESPRKKPYAKPRVESQVFAERKALACVKNSDDPIDPDCIDVTFS